MSGLALTRPPIQLPPNLHVSKPVPSTAEVIAHQVAARAQEKARREQAEDEQMAEMVVGLPKHITTLLNALKEEFHTSKRWTLDDQRDYLVAIRHIQTKAQARDVFMRLRQSEEYRPSIPTVKRVAFEVTGISTEILEGHVAQARTPVQRPVIPESHQIEGHAEGNPVLAKCRERVQSLPGWHDHDGYTRERKLKNAKDKAAGKRPQADSEAGTGAEVRDNRFTRLSEVLESDYGMKGGEG